VVALEDEPDVFLLQFETLLLIERMHGFTHEEILTSPGAVVESKQMQQR
jgi:hypothetical protein